MSDSPRTDAEDAREIKKLTEDEHWSAMRDFARTLERECAALREKVYQLQKDTRWLAFDVGCIECGEESNVIGLFDSEEEAQAACEIAREKQKADWHGQHSFEVFDLTDARSRSQEGR